MVSSLLCITNNTIKHQSFLYTHFNVKTVLFQIIQFSTNHLLAFNLNVKQIYLTHRQDPIRARVNLGAIEMKGYSAFPKLHHYRSLTIRLFSFIYKAFVLPLSRLRLIFFLFPNSFHLDYVLWASLEIHS